MSDQCQITPTNRDQHRPRIPIGRLVSYHRPPTTDECPPSDRTVTPEVAGSSPIAPAFPQALRDFEGESAPAGHLTAAVAQGRAEATPSRPSHRRRATRASSGRPYARHRSEHAELVPVDRVQANVQPPVAHVRRRGPEDLSGYVSSAARAPPFRRRKPSASRHARKPDTRSVRRGTDPTPNNDLVDRGDPAVDRDVVDPHGHLAKRLGHAAVTAVSDSCQITPTDNDQRRRRHVRETACFLGRDHHRSFETTP